MMVAHVAKVHRDTVSLTLPLHIVSESNQREHWAVRAGRVKSHRGTTRLALAGLLLRAGLTTKDGPTSALNVMLTRIAPRKLDSDNLQGGLKATRDGCADAMGVTDNDPRITWLYGQRAGAKRGECGLEVTVWRS